MERRGSRVARVGGVGVLGTSVMPHRGIGYQSVPWFLESRFPFAPDDDPAELDEKFVVPTIGDWDVRSRHTGSVHSREYPPLLL